jgi:hypothetical protein
MTKLPFEAYSQIYKDRATETDYEKYQNVKANLERDFDCISDLDNCQVKALELSVSVFSFRKILTHVGDSPANVTGRFKKFSEYVVNDPLYDSLKQLETFLQLNIDTPDQILKKDARVSAYLNDHPEKRTIPNAEVEAIRNIIVEKFFNFKVMTVNEANTLINIPDQTFFGLIDQKIVKVRAELGSQR